MKMNRLLLLFTIITLLVSGTASAYIGPGMGGGVIAAALGIIGSILLALFGVLYYPIKRAFKNRKEKRKVKKSHDKKPEDQESTDK